MHDGVERRFCLFWLPMTTIDDAVLLYETVDWSAVTFPNLGTGGATYDLDVYSNDYASCLAGAPVWAALGGPPGNAPFTFIFATGNVANYSYAHILWTGDDLTYPWPNLLLGARFQHLSPYDSGLDSISSFCPSASFPGPFSGAFEQDDPLGLTTWIVEIDTTNAAASVWRNGVFFTGLTGGAAASAYINSVIDAASNPPDIQIYRGFVSPGQSDQDARCFRGMAMTRTVLSASDRALWAEHFMEPLGNAVLVYDTYDWREVSSFPNLGTAGNDWDLVFQGYRAYLSGPMDWPALGGLPGDSPMTFVFAVGNSPNFDQGFFRFYGIDPGNTNRLMQSIVSQVSMERRSFCFAPQTAGPADIEDPVIPADFAIVICEIDPITATLSVWYDGVLAVSTSGTPDTALTNTNYTNGTFEIYASAFNGPGIRREFVQNGCRGMAMIRGTLTAYERETWATLFPVPPVPALGGFLGDAVLLYDTRSGYTPIGAPAAVGYLANTGTAGHYYDLDVDTNDAAGSFVVPDFYGRGTLRGSALNGMPGRAPWSVVEVLGRHPDSDTVSPPDGVYHQSYVKLDQFSVGGYLYLTPDEDNNGDYNVTAYKSALRSHAVWGDTPTAGLAYDCRVVQFDPSDMTIEVWINDTLQSTTPVVVGAALTPAAIDAMLPNDLTTTLQVRMAGYEGDASSPWGGIVGMAVTRTFLTATERRAWARHFRPVTGTLVARRLTCGTTQVLVQDRGGSNRRVVGGGSAKSWTSVDWNRLLEEVSGCQVRVEGKAHCADWAQSVVPWRDEIAVYRDGDQAWCGPVTEMTWVDNELRINCKDLSQWFGVRNIHFDHSYDAGTDLGRIFHDLVADGLSVDTSPNIFHDLTSTGVVLNDVGGRVYKASQHQYVLDALRELARTGIDWTMLNRRLIVGGVEIPQTTIPQLTVNHFADNPEVVRSGLDFGTRFHVSGSGRGEAGDTIHAHNDYSAALEATYGVVERNASESQIRDYTSARQNSLSRFDLFGRYGPPQYVTGAELNGSAPVDISDLVPGHVFRLAVGPTPDVTGLFRLSSVSASVGPEHDWVKVNFEPLGLSEST